MNLSLEYPLLDHRHKPVFKFFADGDLFIGNINMIILYFIKLFGVYNV